MAANADHPYFGRRGVRRPRHAPADDPAREHVDDEGDIDEAMPR